MKEEKSKEEDFVVSLSKDIYKLSVNAVGLYVKILGFQSDFVKEMTFSEAEKLSRELKDEDEETVLKPALEELFANGFLKKNEDGSGFIIC